MASIAQTFNRSHERIGPVFQGRYKAIRVEKGRYLLELLRYIILNPVRAGMYTQRKTGHEIATSYRATVGQATKPGYLEVEGVLSTFAKRKSLAIERYKRFVSEGKGQRSPWASLRHQVYLVVLEKHLDSTCPWGIKLPMRCFSGLNLLLH